MEEEGEAQAGRGKEARIEKEEEVAGWQRCDTDTGNGLRDGLRLDSGRADCGSSSETDFLVSFRSRSGFFPVGSGGNEVEVNQEAEVCVRACLFSFLCLFLCFSCLVLCFHFWCRYSDLLRNLCLCDAIWMMRLLDLCFCVYSGRFFISVSAYVPEDGGNPYL